MPRVLRLHDQPNPAAVECRAGAKNGRRTALALSARLPVGLPSPLIVCGDRKQRRSRVDLFEYQAKGLFAEYGVPVPPGLIARTAEEARAAAAEFAAQGHPLVMVKAQVKTGGRGKAGGIKLADGPDDAYAKASQILGMDIKGHTVHSVLITQAIDIAAEYYLSFLLDRANRTFLAICSVHGGMEIEEVAHSTPEAVARIPISPLTGVDAAKAEEIIAAGRIPAQAAAGAALLAERLWDLATGEDATLVEVNPMALTADGVVLAVDGKVTLDDNASFRHDHARFEDVGDTDAIRLASLVVPAITDDAVEGHPDRLGVDADARALAALVASRSLEPPLAIGIYGEWGSGKTFFMKRVQASVDDLAANDVTDAFCSGVAHVWFSAWHYAEGNLWASLLHHVFASLHAGRSRHRLALDGLLEKVQGAQQLTSAVGAEAKAAAMRLDSATAAIDDAKERHQVALQESSKLRARDLWDAVKLSAADQGLKDEVIQAVDGLGLSVATDSARDLAQATRQVIDLGSRARILAVSKPWYRSPLAYALYAAVIVGSLGLLVGAVVHSANQSVITAIAQLAAVGSAVAAWIIRQAGLARRFIAPAETLQQRLDERFAQQREKNDRELAELEKEAGAASAELAGAIQQHALAEQQLAIAKQEQTELTGKRLLRRYLAERADSRDYERYMGVLALAHRDLRDLDEYLQASMSDSDEEDQQLDRIVLYIDDLDRCDPDIVADVLDAVHLLLALRLFVVIVGVDPRWLKRSLRERHPVLLGSAPTVVPSTSSSDYLEKIFQLTYTLPHMSASRCADLLIGAAQDTQAAPTPQHHSLRDDDEKGIESTLQDAEPEVRDRFTEQSEPLSTHSSEYLAEALTLRADDIAALRTVAPLVSTSPRRAKRFLSVYLVIRARALVDPALRDNLSGNTSVPNVAPETLLILVALMMGLPKAMATIIREAQSQIEGENALDTTLTRLTTTPAEQTRLKEFFLSAPSTIKAIPVDAVLQWLPLARPYLPLGIEELHQAEPWAPGELPCCLLSNVPCELMHLLGAAHHGAENGWTSLICRDEERLLSAKDSAASPKALRPPPFVRSLSELDRWVEASRLEAGSTGQTGEPGRRVPAAVGTPCREL